MANTNFRITLNGDQILFNGDYWVVLAPSEGPPAATSTSSVTDPTRRQTTHPAAATSTSTSTAPTREQTTHPAAATSVSTVTDPVGTTSFIAHPAAATSVSSVTDPVGIARPLPPPQNITGTRASPFTGATLSWDAVTGADDYEIMRSPDYRGQFTSVGTTASLTFGDTGLTTSLNYAYQVRARNGIGDGRLSLTVYLGKENETVD